MSKYLAVVAVGIIMGVTARLHMLRVDYRQYPSYPQGYLIHLSLGLIAAFLGAVAVPALISKEYTAVTFLALAAQQFREIRDMERKSLENIEDTELVPRGSAYIEDIAKAFESRNYLAILTALFSSLVLQLSDNIPAAILTGIAAIIVLSMMTRRKKIKDIAVIRPAKIRFENSLLCVENIMVMNVGYPDSRKIIEEQGLAVMIEPKDDNARATLSSIGQRQAIVHDAASLLGVKRDVTDVDFMPLARLDIETGRVGVIIVPMERDIESLIEAVKRVPVLESSRRKPLESFAGKQAED
ncbi:MAG: YIEGIA family protein [Tepidanaerobacteraceae bacterium]|jgi:hypothetical protein|nr:YIEGIA family protein [Tepidanaerobacteraceae bacterium]